MKRNMGSADRIIRIIVAIGLAALYITNTLTGTWGIVALIVAIIFLATSLINFCPIYRIFGLKTCKV